MKTHAKKGLMTTSIQNTIIRLFEDWANEHHLKIYQLPRQGSDRQYFRVSGDKKTAIGVYNPDRKENTAFISFSEHFLSKGLNVPEIYSQNSDKNSYLIQDLGDTTLFSYLTTSRETDVFPQPLMSLYKKVIGALPRFQIEGGREIDYGLCYPRSSFDRQSMMWDLNYFKYYFLKLAKIPFDEQNLEDDFLKFTDYLLEADHDYFMYRDFQSRNIMIRDDEPFFIDYQGGRKGPLQYDLASLLYDAKADLPNEIRQELLERYMETIGQLIKFDRDKFLRHYYGFVLIRIMQALGAYGFRGFYERKEHFLQSVPYAIQNLEWILRNTDLPAGIPELKNAWEQMVQTAELRQFGHAHLHLNVRVQSFSYRRGIPLDEKGNGGGFVFDCRLLPNPGRYDEYKELTGNDPEVIAFLEKKDEVSSFLSQLKTVIDQAVESYQKQNYTDLMIAFGCTGGQHRSVYCANQMTAHLREKYNISVDLRHREQERK